MAERSFAKEVQSLRLGEGEIFHGEGILAVTKALLEQEGIFAGISAGAAVRTAQRLAERLDSGNIVVLLADGGWKYLSTGLWAREYDDIAGDEAIEGQIWW